MTLSPEQIRAIRDCLRDENTFVKILSILSGAVEPSEPVAQERKSIIIVDDEETVGSFIQVILEQQGYETLAVQNGHECLRLLKTRQPHLILMDIGMPNMDGGELFAQVRQLPNGKDIPVIFVTGLILQSEADELNKAREDRKHYLGKPFTPRRLVETVHAMIANPD